MPGEISGMGKGGGGGGVDVTDGRCGSLG